MLLFVKPKEFLQPNVTASNFIYHNRSQNLRPAGSSPLIISRPSHQMAAEYGGVKLRCIIADLKNFVLAESVGNVPRSNRNAQWEKQAFKVRASLLCTVQSRYRSRLLSVQDYLACSVISFITFLP